MPSAGIPGWSVIIPAYNEARRLPAYLDEVVAYFEGLDRSYEVLVVDDGSSDGTATHVLEAQAGHPAVTLHRLAVNHGKGFAVRATPIGELKRLEAAILAGADIAVGSRALRDPSVTRQVRLHRKLSGEVFNFLVRRLGLPDVADTQCGFKLFRAEVATVLFGELETIGFGFDVELLLLAQRRGYRVTEVAVNWADQPGSKVTVFRDGPHMVRQILAARRRLARRPSASS